MAKPHFASHFSGNLMWDRDGGVTASWALEPLPRARTEDLAGAVRRAHTALFRSLVGHDILLRGLLTWTDPAHVAARMIDGVDLAEHPEWAEECNASIDLLADLPLGQRRWLLTVPIRASNAWTARTAARSALNQLCETVGIAPAPPTPGEVEAYRATATTLAKNIPAVFNPTPMTVAQQIWALRHAQTRSGQGELDPVQAPDLAEELLDVHGRAAVGEPWLDPMALSDLDSKHTARQRLGAPIERRVLKVATDSGIVNYQAGIMLASLPANGMVFPDTEYLGRVDDAGIPLDIALHVTIRSRHEALQRNKKAIAQLSDQLDQVGDANPDQASHQVRLYDAAELLADYNSEMLRDPREVEVEPVVLMSTIGTTLEEADDNAADFIRHPNNENFTLARPIGAEEAMFWAMMTTSGRRLTKQLRDYRQITKAASLATCGAITSSDLGTRNGFLFAINKTTALWSPVFMDLFGDARHDLNPAFAVVGELGSGKSFAMKKIAGHCVDRGARLVATDNSSTREWLTFCQSLVADHGNPISISLCDVAAPTTSIDPLRILPPGEAGPVMQSFLITLLDIAATSIEGRTLAKILKPTYLKRHTIHSSGALRNHLATSCDLPEAREIASRMEVFSDPDTGGSLAAAVFDEHLPPIDTTARAIIIGTSSVSLPTDHELSQAHLFRGLSVEKIFGRALFALIAKLYYRLCFADNSQPAVFACDEFHFMRSSLEAVATMADFIRYGRKALAAALIGSHDPEADFADETLRGLIKNRLVMRHSDQLLAARSATFLGINPVEFPHQHAELVDKIRTLSPNTDGHGVPEDRRGEGVLRDSRGRVGDITVLRPALQARYDAIKTTPPPVPIT